MKKCVWCDREESEMIKKNKRKRFGGERERKI